MSSHKVATLVVAIIPAFFVFPKKTCADVLKITSNPSGATVEIDGVVVGTTPYEKKVPGGYFKKTKTAFGSTLEHPMRCRVSLKGYIPKELDLATGPIDWRNLYGNKLGEYYLLKSKLFHFELEKASENRRIGLKHNIPLQNQMFDAPTILLILLDGQGNCRYRFSMSTDSTSSANSKPNTFA